MPSLSLPYPRLFFSKFIPEEGLPPLLVAFLCALYLLAFANVSLWQGAAQALAAVSGGTFLLCILGVMLALLYTGITYCLLWRGMGKALLMMMFFIAAIGAYAMDAYGTHIGPNMIQNALETNWREMHGLLSWNLLAYLVLIGVIPSVLLLFIKIDYPKFHWQLLLKPLIFSLTFLLALGLLYANFQTLSAFGRNNRPLRYFLNPWMPLYYSYDYYQIANAPPIAFKTLGQHATIGAPVANASQPTLIIMVVGESSRAQEYSLNGYARNTNPQLAQVSNLFSFQKATSCGTDTAVSVPCMFSPYDRSTYSESKALNTSDVLDILAQAGVTVYWRDNNSGSKGMARPQNGVIYEDVSQHTNPAFCPKNRDHCFDGILLAGLQSWLDKQQGNILIVLHLYGSHGPGYYKRYPAAFQHFQPICKTNVFGDCSPQSIINSYDNTVLYTDHVLASAIAFLQRQHHYSTGLFYLSDHGESLGEHGIYLHGMPRAIAPSQQTHIPFLWWMSDSYAKKMQLSGSCLKNRLDTPVSQADVFSSLLGMFAAQTKAYDASLDFLAPCRH